MPAELILHRLRTTEVDVEPDVRLIVLGPETEESDPPQDATVATVVKAARTKKATLIGVRFMSGSCPVKESKPKPATHQWRPRSDRTSGAMTSEPEPPSRSDIRPAILRRLIAPRADSARKVGLASREIITLLIPRAQFRLSSILTLTGSKGPSEDSYLRPAWAELLPGRGGGSLFFHQLSH